MKERPLLPADTHYARAAAFNGMPARRGGERDIDDADAMGDAD